MVLDRQISTESELQKFPTTITQRAYLIGQSADQPLGGVDCLAYGEFYGTGLTVELLKPAVQRLQRHPALRAAIQNSDYLVDIAAAAPTIRVHDFTEIPLKELENKLVNIRNRLVASRFDLAKGESWFVELTLLPNNATVLHIVMSLVVSDLAGLSLMINELAETIKQLKIGGELSFPKNIYFNEMEKVFAANNLKLPENSAETLSSRVNEVWMPPALPLLKSLNSTSSNSAATKDESVEVKFFRLTAKINNKIWQRIGNLAKELNTTRAAITLALYAETLRRWIVASADSASNFILTIPGLNISNTIGYIADRTKTYLLRCADMQNSNAAAAFKEMANELRYRISRDIAASVELRNEVATGNGHPGLSPFVFTYSGETELISNSVSEVLGETKILRSTTPQVVIDCQVFKLVPDFLQVSFDVRSGFISQKIVEQIFTTFIESIKEASNLTAIAAKKNSLSSLVNLPKSIQLARSELNNIPGVAPQTLLTAVQNSMAKFPDKVAIIWSDSFNTTDLSENSEIEIVDPIATKYSQLTYSQLDGLAKTLASQLRKYTKIGDVVAIELPKGPGQIVAVLAVMYAGCAYLPLAFDIPVTRRKTIYDIAKPAFVIKAANLPTSIMVENFIPIQVSPESLAYLIFTSGSTGVPKGVMMSHKAAANTVREIAQRHDLTDQDSLLAVASLEFDLSVFDIFGVLGSGATLVCISESVKKDPFYWIEQIIKYQITYWNSAPAMVEMLINAMGEGEILPLKKVFCSGDWISLDLPKKLFQIAPQASLVAMGGATEAGIWSNEFVIDPTTNIDNNWSSIPYGYPLAGQYYRVADIKGRDCPANILGELWIGGESLADGYLGADELTKQSFIIQDGIRWYKTGDLGYWDDSNKLIFMGRKDNQVKIRGYRVELGEIEHQFRIVFNFTQVVVVPVQNNNTLAAVVAGVGNGTLLTTEKMQLALANILPQYMIPSYIIPVDEIPLTNNGKVDRKWVKNFLQKSTFVEKNRTSDIETIQSTSYELNSIIAAFTDILATRVNPETNFFAAGGDSIQAAQVCKKLRDKGFVVEVIDLFTYPCAIDLAYQLFQRKNSDTAVELVTTANAIDQNVIHDKDLKVFPLTPLQRAYALGADGILGEVCAPTKFATILRSYDPKINAYSLQVAAQKLTDHWDSLRCVRTDESKQEIKNNITVPIQQISEPLIDFLINYTPKTICEIITSSVTTINLADKVIEKKEKFRDIGIVINYLALDARSLTSLINAIIQVAAGAPLPDNVDSGIFNFAAFAINQSALSQHHSVKVVEKNEIAKLPVNQIPEGVLTFGSMRFTISDLEKLRSTAKTRGITLTTLILGEFGATLATALKTENITIALPISYRPDSVDENEEQLGNYTYLAQVKISKEPNYLSLTEQIGNALVVKNKINSGIILNNDNKSNAFPIVFTSTLGLNEIKLYKNKSNSILIDSVKSIWSLTSTPGVLLDCQVNYNNSEVEVRWDYPKNIINEEFLQNAFNNFKYRLGVKVPAIKFSTKQLITLLLETLPKEKILPDLISVILVWEKFIADSTTVISDQDYIAKKYWNETDFEYIKTIFLGKRLATSILQHKKLSPSVIISQSKEYQEFMDKIIFDIKSLASLLNRPIRILMLGATASEFACEHIKAINIPIELIVLEPDRLLAHLAFQSGCTVVNRLPETPMDIIFSIASLHRDPRLISQLNNINKHKHTVFWLYEPTQLTEFSLISAAILNPSILEHNKLGSIIDWAEVLIKAGFEFKEGNQSQFGIILLKFIADKSIVSKSVTVLSTKPKIEILNHNQVESITKLTAAAWVNGIANLKLDEINSETDFFISGGESLAATKVVNFLHEAGYNSVRMVDLFNFSKFGDFITEIMLPAVKNITKIDASNTEKMVVDAEIDKVKNTDNNWLPLTLVQQAYLVGRDPNQILGGVAAHCYFEFHPNDFRKKDFINAIDVVLQRHPILNAIVTSPTTAKIAQVDSNKIVEFIPNPRAKLSAEVSNLNTPTALHIGINDTFKDKSAIIGISMDNLWLDGASMFLILKEIDDLYNGLKLPAIPKISLADYLQRHNELLTSSISNSDLENIAMNFPAVPKIWNKSLIEIQEITFARVATLISKNIWEKIINYIARKKITPVALLLAAYMQQLGKWSQTEELTINVTQFDRDWNVPGIEKIAGDFTRLFLVAGRNISLPLLELAQVVQKEIIIAHENSEYTTIPLQRYITQKTGNPLQALFPLVFTSGLGLSISDIDKKENNSNSTFNSETIKFACSQTPQTVLDCQVFVDTQGLHITFDYITQLISPTIAKENIADLAQRIENLEQYIRENSINLINSKEINIETQIKNIWAEVLDVKKIDSTTNFYQAGGDSLKATQMIRALQDKGIQGVNLRTLLIYPNFGDFINQIVYVEDGTQAISESFEEGVL